MQQSKEFYLKNLQDLALTGQSTSEQETIITWRREDKTAHIETTDSTVLTKLKRCALSNPAEWVFDDVTILKDEKDPLKISSISFSCPKKFISLRTKSIAGREMTEEERAAVAERFANIRKKSLIDESNDSGDEDI